MFYVNNIWHELCEQMNLVKNTLLKGMKKCQIWCLGSQVWAAVPPFLLIYMSEMKLAFVQLSKPLEQLLSWNVAFRAGNIIWKGQMSILLYPRWYFTLRSNHPTQQITDILLYTISSKYIVNREYVFLLKTMQFNSSRYLFTIGAFITDPGNLVVDCSVGYSSNHAHC